MDVNELDEILACLDGEKWCYSYFKDKYAVNKISRIVKKTMNNKISIRELKKNVGSGVAQKSVIANTLKYFGQGHICGSDMIYFVPKESINFSLSLSKWGSNDPWWDQTSRNAKNLVLQLNFSESHVREYKRRVKPLFENGPFECNSHPINTNGKKTLAWARLDLDFNTNELLIEEVQNDWIRDADRDLRRVRKSLVNNPNLAPIDVLYDIEGSISDLEHYVEVELVEYRKLWAEAMLNAVLEFSENALGINNIYYHSYDTGRKIKNAGSPPMSLYTKLPRKFGFKLTQVPPTFLKRDKVSRRRIKAIGETQWYHLAL